MGRPITRKIIFNIILLLLFFGLMVFLTVKFTPEITGLVRNPERFRSLLTAYGPLGILVFILLQALQVIIALIPGELIQLAGGYIYGTIIGTIFSMAGILLGSVGAFYAARLLGFRLVKLLVSESELDRFNFLVNNPRSEWALFLLFLIPGVPKDILVYLGGFTPIKPAKFFFILAVARFPGLLGTSFIGSNIQERDYRSVIVVSIFAGLLFIIGLWKKDQIINKVHRLLNRDQDH